MFLRFKSRGRTGELSDEEILKLYGSTLNGRLIRELFTRYTYLLFGVAFKILMDEEEAKDAVMKSFEKLLTTSSLEEIRNFRSWICVVVKNQCLMELRHRGVESRTIAAILALVEPEVAGWGFLPFAEGEDYRGKIKERLANFISRLSEDQKICISLFYLEEKSYEEITRVTGYSLNSVKSYIQNGKRNLKNMVEHAGIKES